MLRFFGNRLPLVVSVLADLKEALLKPTKTNLENAVVKFVREFIDVKQQLLPQIKKLPLNAIAEQMNIDDDIITVRNKIAHEHSVALIELSDVVVKAYDWLIAHQFEYLYDVDGENELPASDPNKIIQKIVGLVVQSIQTDVFGQPGPEDSISQLVDAIQELYKLDGDKKQLVIGEYSTLNYICAGINQQLLLWLQSFSDDQINSVFA